MISFNDFRRRQLNSAIYHTDSFLEGIHHHFDICRLDLLEAARISYTITEGRDPEVVEALNWIIDYDNARHEEIINSFIDEAKYDFCKNIQEEVNLDTLVSTLPSDAAALKLRIKTDIDQIVSAHQKEIIAKLLGTAPDQTTTAPATPDQTTTAPATPAATQPTVQPVVAPSSPAAPATPGKEPAWFKQSKRPGLLGGLANFAKTAAQGIGKGIRGAYRWVKDAYGGKYLAPNEQRMVAQVVSLMENLYEDVDPKIALAFEPLKASLTKYMGMVIDRGQAAPGSPVSGSTAAVAPVGKPVATMPMTARVPGEPASVAAPGVSSARAVGETPSAIDPGATPPEAQPAPTATPPEAQPAPTATPPSQGGDVNQYIASLPSGAQAFFNRIKLGEYVKDSALNKWQKYIDEKLGLYKKSDVWTADKRLGLYNQYRNHLEAPAVTQIPPQISQRFVGDIRKALDDKTDPKAFYRLIMNTKLTPTVDYNNLLDALGIRSLDDPKPASKRSDFIQGVADKLRQPEAMQNLNQRAGAEELKAKQQGNTILPQSPETPAEPEVSPTAIEPEAAPVTATAAAAADKLTAAAPKIAAINAAAAEKRAAAKAGGGLGSRAHRHGQEPIEQPSPELQPEAHPQYTSAYKELSGFLDGIEETGNMFPDKMFASVKGSIPTEQEVMQMIQNGTVPDPAATDGDWIDAVGQAWTLKLAKAHGLSVDELDNELDAHTAAKGVLAHMRAQGDKTTDDAAILAQALAVARHIIKTKQGESKGPGQAPTARVQVQAEDVLKHLEGSSGEAPQTTQAPQTTEARQVMDSLPENIRAIVDAQGVQESIDKAKAQGLDLEDAQNIARIIARNSLLKKKNI